MSNRNNPISESAMHDAILMYYFNKVAFQNGLITAQQRDRLDSMIKSRYHMPDPSANS